MEKAVSLYSSSVSRIGKMKQQNEYISVPRVNWKPQYQINQHYQIIQQYSPEPAKAYGINPPNLNYNKLLSRAASERGQVQIRLKRFRGSAPPGTARRYKFAGRNNTETIYSVKTGIDGGANNRDLLSVLFVSDSEFQGDGFAVRHSGLYYLLRATTEKPIRVNILYEKCTNRKLSAGEKYSFSVNLKFHVNIQVIYIPFLQA